MVIGLAYYNEKSDLLIVSFIYGKFFMGGYSNRSVHILLVSINSEISNTTSLSKFSIFNPHITFYIASRMDDFFLNTVNNRKSNEYINSSILLEEEVSKFSEKTFFWVLFSVRDGAESAPCQKKFPRAIL